MAAQVPRGTRIISIERDPEAAQVAHIIHKHAGVGNQIKIIVDTTENAIPRLKRRFHIRSFDLIFIDHAGSLYLPDFKLLERHGLIKSGTMIVADNVITPGAPDYLRYVRNNRNYTTQTIDSTIEYQDDIPDAVEITKIMSEEIINTTPDQLPNIPETQVIEPVVQCGVLYLGTAPPTPGRRGLDSIQEPFAHRYPVDGTNTARGIDAVLSIYDNGIQLTFARQPHTVIFFPISSLIYCASLRFSVVENDQTSLIDWRFVTLDSTLNDPSKHPPLFCAVVQRTQILQGDECHCFITKSNETALALVRTISEVYANLSANIRSFKSPIFYQLDRYGRKISETSGVIYISPATDDESQLNRITDRSSSIPAINRNCLLDPSLDGFFYRTDGNIIEQWQLWDDDDLTGSRPRPPPSPFGQNQALYHDDLTQEIHHYLRRMEDEEASSTCSCSSSSVSSREYNRHHRRRQKSKYDQTDQINISALQSQTSAFEPTNIQNNIDSKKTQQGPIIIEKVVPNQMTTISQKQPTYILQQPQSPYIQQQPQSPYMIQQPQSPYIIEQPPPLPFNHSIPIQETSVNYAPYSEDYQVNERGEKITNEGNRILYMDVIQPNMMMNNNNNIEPIPYIAQPVMSRPRRRRRRPKSIPIIDLQSVEKIFSEKKPKQRRRTSIISDQHNIHDEQLSTSDMLEIVEGYFEDYKGRKIKLDGHDAQTMLSQLESSSKRDRRRSKSSNNKTSRRRQSYSTMNVGPTVSYVDRSIIKSPPKHGSIEQPQQQQPPTFNNEQVNEYVSNIYGTCEKTSQSIRSTATPHHEPEPSNQINTVNPTEQDFISPFRYMQSSINPLLLREYRHTFGGI
ncbi:unnamed protein product [Adineta steineri]|uniref:catechol O-methyltransferase n=1 Tax=Adineta steineri TaxID=433720 RepID=A0A814LHG1_9BILA|nr:unnamed protein product [Adineta steineri]